MVEINAVMRSAGHPEKGSISILFPVEEDRYEAVIRELNTLGMGDAAKRDCLVLEMAGDYPILKCLEGQAVNLDELNYLAKRMDSLWNNEKAQFQAMAHKMGLKDVKDLINLTFCCQQATVITNFADLEQIGRDHQMALHGGSMPMEEYQALDGRKEAVRLILNETGTVTPYGVVYDNGMVMEPVYNGRQFPCYIYEGVQDVLLTLEITPAQGLQKGDGAEYIYLPACQQQIERAMIRAGISPADGDEMRICLVETTLPWQFMDLLDPRQENLGELNTLCSFLVGWNKEDMLKLEAVVEMAKPQDAAEIRSLAEYLDQFDFAPNISMPEEYGKYLIQESGKYQYDPALEKFYNYELCGEERITEEQGQFNGLGYVAYHGTLTLDELLQKDPAEAYQQEQGS